MPASGDLKRCTKCGEEMPRAEFSRDRSRKDGRLSQCKACVRRRQQENAEHLVDYRRRWQQANREKNEPRTAVTVSGSARTPNTVSEGEQTPAAAIGSGEPMTRTIWSAGEPTTAAAASGSEPEPPTQTTAERIDRARPDCRVPCGVVSSPDRSRAER
jgi:hypothetical protein